MNVFLFALLIASILFMVVASLINSALLFTLAAFGLLLTFAIGILTDKNPL